jgi:hypothetical protein
MPECLGVLKAALRDFEGGYVLDLRSLIVAEVLEDFLDQAEHLLKHGYHAPAASLYGAVLEDSLRTLCAAKEIHVPERTSIDRLNVELARAEVYNKHVQKRITALADIRNNADHGRFDQFKAEDVEDMLAWIKRFCADYLE